ncbi:MAG: hypothetical protein K0V04_27680 [Deltaproteobacteria bacterium]|nr:hypothetical protein [Deltaproteobacteria bacterium]
MPAAVDGPPESPPPPEPAAAHPIATDRVPFPFGWSVGLAAGFPVNGLKLSRTIARRWHVRIGAGMGYPFPVVSVGGSASVTRGFALGRIVTLAPGVTVDGFSTRSCSAGGCGERHSYIGAGPMLALHFHIARVERVWLGIGVSGGATVAFVRERMKWVQPNVQVLDVAIGF